MKNINLELRVESKIRELYGEDIRSLKHSIQAAIYTKSIVKDELSKNQDLSGDSEIILVSAAYLHDIGYIGLIGENYTYDEKRKAKEEHRFRGAKLAYELTGDLGFSFSHRHIISFLIQTHDKIDEVYTPLQQVLMEGDSLSMLDYDNVPQTLSKEELSKFLTKFEGRRGAMFETAKGIELKDRLYPIALEFHKHMYI